MAFKGGCSCYDKAGPDEPIFTLRAQDELAELVVRYWANLAACTGTSLTKVHEAQRVADQMAAWRETHKTKVPD